MELNTALFNFILYIDVVERAKGCLFTKGCYKQTRVYSLPTAIIELCGVSTSYLVYLVFFD